jgi:hypothetical protein
VLFASFYLLSFAFSAASLAAPMIESSPESGTSSFKAKEY